MQRVGRPPKKKYRCGHCQTPSTRYLLSIDLKRHIAKRHKDHAHHEHRTKYSADFLNTLLICDTSPCEFARVLDTYNEESYNNHFRSEHNVRRGSRIFEGVRWVASRVNGVRRSVSELLFDPPDQWEEEI